MTKQKAVIFVEKTNFKFYASNLSQIYVFEYPADTVKDLEVINKDIISQQIKSFIEANKLVSSDLIIVLSDEIIFGKEFPSQLNEDQEEQIQGFLNSIPFDEVGYNRIISENSIFVIAANRELYKSIQNSFEKAGFYTITIIPIFALEKDNIAMNGFTQDVAELIIKRIETLKQYSLETTEEHTAQIALKEKQDKSFLSTRIHTSTIALISIFVVLIGILVFMLIKNPFAPAQKPKSAILPPLPSPTSTLLITPLPTEASSSTSGLIKSMSTVSVTLQSSVGQEAQVQVITNLLRSKGITQITPLPTSIASSNTVIIFNPSLPIDIKNTITTEITKALPNAIAQENKDASSDVVILIGK